MPICIYILCNTACFVTFPEVAIVRCSRKCLFLKYCRKMRAEFLEMLMASSLRQFLQTYSEVCIFCSAIQHIVSKKQQVGTAHEMSADSLEIVFDQAHFVVN